MLMPKQLRRMAADSAKGKVNNPFFRQDSTGGNAIATEISTSQLTEDDQPSTTTPANSALVNANCSNMVTDGDLDKLKKRIVSETDQDAILTNSEEKPEK